MKKATTILMLALVGSALTFTSCNKKKDWNCNCTNVIGGQTINSTAKIDDQTKSDASDACDKIQSDYRSAGATSTCSVSER